MTGTGRTAIDGNARTTLVLLVAAALGRLAVPVLVAPPGDATGGAVAALGVAVPVALALGTWRAAAWAPAGVLALGALAAGQLVLLGTDQQLLGDLGGAVAPTAVELLSSLLAGGTVVARWQDRGAPAVGTGRLGPRLLVVAAALAAGVRLATTVLVVRGPSPVSADGFVRVDLQVRALDAVLVLAALAPVAWAARRRRPVHLAGAAVVVGATVLATVPGDVALLGAGLPPWLAGIEAVALLGLLVVAPLLARRPGQVTSSSA